MASGGSSSGRQGFNQLSCPRHPEANLIEDHQAGDMICPECGLVVGDRVIDVGSEWRTFSNDSGSTDRSRVGGTEDPLMGGNELTTFIDSKTTVYSIGNKETQNFTKWQKSGNSGDRGLVSAFAEIGVMANRIHLPKSIMDRAKELFKQVHEEKTLKGRANDAIASACLYIACRQDGVPRSFKEICAVSRHSKKEIGRCFKLIHKAMKSEMAVVDSKDFMSRFCTQLSLTSAVQKAAIHISQKAQELDLAPGRMYLSVAAAAIYMASQASDTKKTQKEVGEIVGVADSTIRQTYRLLYKDRDKLFPPDFQFTTPLDDLPNH